MSTNAVVENDLGVCHPCWCFILGFSWAGLSTVLHKLLNSSNPPRMKVVIKATMRLDLSVLRHRLIREDIDQDLQRFPFGSCGAVVLDRCFQMFLSFQSGFLISEDEDPYDKHGAGCSTSF